MSTYTKTLTKETHTREENYPGDEACRICETMCAPCQACLDSQDGECYKCWHCWDWDSDELGVVDASCDALAESHDWDDEEVRCLTNENAVDCRACWAGGDGKHQSSSKLEETEVLSI